MAHNQRPHLFANAGNTLSRAGTSARQGLSNFFGINQESRDIWSEKFQQRINVSSLIVVGERLGWAGSRGTGNKCSGDG